MWLHALDSHGDEMPSLRKIAEVMKAQRNWFNEKSQSELGDKSLGVHAEEIVLTRSNGASKK